MSVLTKIGNGFKGIGAWFKAAPGKVVAWPVKTKIIAGVTTAAVVVTSVGGAVLVYDRTHITPSEEEPVAVVERPVTEVAEVEPLVETEVVDVPEFSQMAMTGTSMEKDLKIYFSSSTDSASRITGVPFSIMILESGEKDELQDALDGINVINTAILKAAEDEQLTLEYDEELYEELLHYARVEVLGEEKAEEVESGKTEATSDDADTEEESSAKNESTEEDSTSTEREVIHKMTREDGTPYTIGDQLLVQKKIDILAYSSVIATLSGKTYTDDDEDGLIYLNKLEEGTFSIAYVPTAETEDYDAAVYVEDMKVKGQIEYVKVDVTQEIDESAPDVAEPVRVEEAALVDTVEYVASTEKKEVSYTEAAVGNAPAASVSGSRTLTLSLSANHTTGRKNTVVAVSNPLKTYFTGSAIATPAFTLLRQSHLLATDDGIQTSGELGETGSGDGSGDTGSDNSGTTTPGTGDGGTTTPDTGSGDSGAGTGDSGSSGTGDSGSGSTDSGTTTDPTPTTPTSVNISIPQSVKLYITADGTGSSASFDVTLPDGTTEFAVAKHGSGDFTVTNSGKTVTVTAGKNTVSNGIIVFAVAVNGKVYTSSAYVVNVVNSGKLTDASGNQLYIDQNGTEATVANYSKSATYYVKNEKSFYTGWQTINGKSYYYDKNGNPVSGTQVIQGTRYNFGSDGQLMVSGAGVDVSKWQGNINWNQVATAVSFAIVRVGYRSTATGGINVDPYAVQNIRNAKAAGLTVGVYFYSGAMSEAEAVEEASLAIQVVQQAGGISLPIFFDWEGNARTNQMNSAQAAANINAFCNTVRNSGYRAGLYADKTHLTSKINMGSIAGNTMIWCAQYNTTCTYTGHYDIWQYTSSGSVPGISGNVDMNVSFF